MVFDYGELYLFAKFYSVVNFFVAKKIENSDELSLGLKEKFIIAYIRILCVLNIFGSFIYSVGVSTFYSSLI